MTSGMAAAVFGEAFDDGCKWDEVVADPEEHEWLPNPYQAQADAQVLAGAWPGSPVIMFGMGMQDDASSWSVAGVSPGSWQALEGMQSLDGMGWDMEQMQQMPLGTEAMSPDYICWDASPWQCLVEVFPDGTADGTPDGKPGGKTRSVSAGSVSTLAFMEEGDMDADTVESVATSGEETNLLEGQDADETSTIGGMGTDRRGVSGRYSRKLSHQCVPKRTDLGKRYSEDVEKDYITTLMVRNIPNMYTRSMLMEELNSLGFENEYDFIYLPMDKSTQWNVGYAFVNFTTPAVAKRVIKEMTNYAFQRYDHGSGKVAQISIAHIQGLEKNLEYYSNTAVQCARIQTYRPLVLGGKQGGHHSPSAAETQEAPQQRTRRRRRLRSQQEEEEEEAVHVVHSPPSSKNHSRRKWNQDRRGHAWSM